MGKFILKTLFFLLAGYLMIVGLLTLFQNQLIFHPSGELWKTPESLSRVWSEHRIETPDGVTLHGWMIGDPETQPVVIYSHGNAGNISGRIDLAGVIANQGAAVFLYDYRGYGKSEGSPTEEGIYMDGLAVVHYLRDTLEIPENRMIFYGRSLGGAVAARQAAEFEAAGLVLDSAFLSGKEIATDIYPFIPRFLVYANFPVDEDLVRSKPPTILVMHGLEDRIIPYRHGEQIYQIASVNSEKEVKFVELKGGHNNSFSASQDKYEEGWKWVLSKAGG